MRFKSEPTLETQSRSDITSETGRTRSVVGVDLKVVGDMNCAGEIQIDGTVQGDINSNTVTVGEGGRTDGLISADTVHIRGTVKGETRAACVVVAGTARVEGNIKYQSLSIEPGAVLDGVSCQLQSPANPQSTNP